VQATTIDAGDFRHAQKQQWNQAARGWQKWAPFQDSSTQPVSDRLVELAGVEPGSRVLDVACGYGEPALTAARIAGPDGHVTATDIAPQMIAFGRERAAAAGVHNLEFIECPAASLEFPAQSFDAGLSRWGLIFEPEGEATAARIRRFLEPGARMAISSWGPPERAPLISVPMRAVLGHLELPAPPPGTPGPLSRPTAEAIGGLLEGGGFSDVQVEEIELDFSWDSPEDFTIFIQDIVAPLVAIVAEQPPQKQESAWSTVTEAARAHANDDGSVTLRNLVLLASGRA
jgi:SAM-dependent methyltransferase